MPSLVDTTLLVLDQSDSGQQENMTIASGHEDAEKLVLMNVQDSSIVVGQEVETETENMNLIPYVGGTNALFGMQDWIGPYIAGMIRSD